jgi:hypothetical protein
MFTDCPYCGFPVALDDDGLPLPRCPNCAQRLRAGADAPDAQAATAAQEAGDGSDPVRAAPDHAAAPAAAEARAIAPPASDPARPAPQASPDAGEAGDPPATPGVAAAPPAPPAAPPAPAAPAPAAMLPVAAQPVAPQARTDADASSGNAAQGDDTGVAAASPNGPYATSAAASGSVHGADTDPAIAAPPAHPAGTRASGATAMQDDTSRAPDAIPGTHAAQAPADADTAATTTVDAALPVPHPAPADPAATPSPPVARRRNAGAAPSFARSAARAPAVSGKRRALEAGAVVGLLLLLALQLLLADRARLAADARWRPVVAALCGALRCALPVWREPAAFRVVERDVRAHGAGVLRVSARIRNEARWAQPWPALQLTLSDTHGREVATRIFQPREYLGAAPSQPELASGQDASLSMEIVEPGTQAVAFTFDFR